MVTCPACIVTASPAGMLQASIARGLAYAPYADLLWMETDKPSLEEAKEFADAIHAKYPGKMLAYNCSPSFNWEKHLNKQQLDTFCKVKCCLIAVLAVPTLPAMTLLCSELQAWPGMALYVILALHGAVRPLFNISIGSWAFTCLGKRVCSTLGRPSWQPACEEHWALSRRHFVAPQQWRSPHMLRLCRTLASWASSSSL